MENTKLSGECRDNLPNPEEQSGNNSNHNNNDGSNDGHQSPPSPTRQTTSNWSNPNFEMLSNADRLMYPSRDGTYFSQFKSRPFVTTLNGFSQVANLVRNPYDFINNFDEYVRRATDSSDIKQRSKASKSSENFARTLNQNRQSLTPAKTPVLQEMDTFLAYNRGSTSVIDESNDTKDEDKDVSTSPIPTLPSIDASTKKGRLEPLTIEEYEEKYRESSTDLELIERIFAGSMACNELRAALWPYLFGLVIHRGRFEKVSGPMDDQKAYIFVEHNANNSRWRELNKLYDNYQSQWQAILPDQETRFSTFRERKSLIERDVIRCDRLHPFYAEEPGNLSKLTQLLMTYMMYDFDIGYVQGMSDLAGPILYLYKGDLVKSFWVFVEVMNLFRRNFELTQKTIHFQLNCLYELIKNTDPVFAQYLEDNESSNCFFAFRAIVCQFKRELMKEVEDDYSKVLFLWDTIWCVARRCTLLSEMKLLEEDVDMLDEKEPLKEGKTKSITEQPTSASNLTDNLIAISVDPNQADAPRYKLTETEIFVIALCLSMARRERDIILANRLDSTDIHLHFIDPKLANDLDSFIEHAINIYSFLKNDFDLTKLTCPQKQQIISTANVFGSDQQANNSMDTYADASPVSASNEDFLSDFLIINGAS